MSVASTTTAPLIPDQVLPDLYVSDVFTARAVLSPNFRTATRPHIRYILSLLDSADRQPKVAESHRSDFVMKLIIIDDSVQSNLLAVLNEACDFIQTSLTQADGGVLVHCQRGISRSASVILAYVMRDMHIDYDAALRFVRNGRPQAKPNAGFEEQLKLWAEMRYDIHQKNGAEKPQYIAWKIRNREAQKERPAKLTNGESIGYYPGADKTRSEKSGPYTSILNALSLARG